MVAYPTPIINYVPHRNEKQCKSNYNANFCKDIDSPAGSYNAISDIQVRFVVRRPNFSVRDV